MSKLIKHISNTFKVICYIGLFFFFVFLTLYNIGPSQNKIIHFLSIFYAPATAFIVLMLFYAVIKKKYIYAVILLCLFILGFKSLKETFQWNTQEIGSEQSFTLMSYNVASFHPERYDRFTGSELNNQKIFDWFRSIEKPDILCIQEFFHGYSNDGELTLDSIKTIGGYGYYYLNPYYRNSYNGFFGAVTFSKFKSIKAGELVYGKSKLNKGVYHDFIVYGDTIRVINVHLSSMSIRLIPFLEKKLFPWISLNFLNIHQKLIDGHEEHVEEIAVIKNFIDESPHKVILCGDFNSFPYQYPYQMIKQDLDNAFEKKGRGFGLSYHYRPFYIRIDQIFYDPRLKILSYEVHKENPWSDHYPISASFEVGN